ncbi:MAG: CHASE3 domain-containing protein, partial [Gammaproteobacteria bacterium]|nr:CHASE3 domain-containing protein [Gammaproteobacteria bacterium]
MKWTVGTKIAAGFGLTLMIFLIVGGFSYHTTIQLIEVSDARKHTSDVLTQLTGMLSLLTDVENGDRGYVITGEESYLQPYHAALARLDPLRNMTAGNPHQQQRLHVLEPLVKNRVAVASANVDARRTKGVQAASAIIKSGKGKAFMDKIRKVLGTMQSEEEAILQTRVDRAETEAQNAKAIIVLGTLAALVLAAITGLIITRNIAGPLRQLTAVAERITVGDLSGSLPATTRGDEVGA